MNDAAAQQLTYAGLGQRGLALFLDNLVWFFLLAQIAGNIPQRIYEDEPVVVGVIFLALFSAWFNYFWLTEWKWGKTLGKAIVSIHVTAEDGGRVAFGPSTVRNLLRLVDILVIGPVLIANTERHQRLGDRFGHTIVVRDGPPPPVPRPAIPNPGPAMAPVQGTTNPATADAGASSRQDHTANSQANLPGVLGSRASGSGARRGTDSPWAGKGIGIAPATWKPLTVLWGILATLGLLTVETIVVAAFDPDLESVGAKLAVQALLAGTLVGVALFFAGSLGSPVEALKRLGLRRFVASALGLAALTFVAYVFFAAIYAALVQPEQEDVTRELGFDEGGFGAIATGVLIVAAAPVSEEIFFRGFMYGGLRTRFPVWAAALISGTVFGLLHYTGPDSIGVVPQLAVLGILLAWLYERTGSLWPAIILHVINNSIALVVLTSG